jgi:hypothetical protein
VPGHDLYAWAQHAPEATVAAVADGPGGAQEVLARVGPVQLYGELSLDGALELQGGLYDDGTFEERAVFQISRLPGSGGSDWWVTLEPNGWRASIDQALCQLAAGHAAASFFWNVNAVMLLTRVEGGRITSRFDPLVPAGAAPEEGRDLPFREQPMAAALTLLERWTGVVITEQWFLGIKPTFMVDTPSQ